VALAAVADLVALAEIVDREVLVARVVPEVLVDRVAKPERRLRAFSPPVRSSG
jgi:hypothetical protein